MKSTKFKNFDKAEYVIKLRKPRKELVAEGICDYPEQDRLNRIFDSPPTTRINRGLEIDLENQDQGGREALG